MFRVHKHPAKVSLKSNKVPISYEDINSYVDQFPMLVIIRLKEKFDSYCKERTSGQTLQDFKNFYVQLDFDDVINYLYSI